MGKKLRNKDLKIIKNISSASYANNSNNINISNNWDRKGSALHHLQRWEDALHCHQKAIDINPENSNAWDNRGFVLRQLEQYDEALDCHQHALDIDYDFDRACYNKGVVLERLGQYEEAIASYDRAVKIKPDYFDAWNNRGGALVNLGEYQEAVASYDRAIELKPDYYEALDNKGVVLHRMGEYEEALKYHQRALDINPSNSNALDNKGCALAQMGEHEEALKYHQRALDINPSNSNALDNKGAVLHRMGEYEEALKYYQRALDINPSNSNAWINRAITIGNLQGYHAKVKAYQDAFEYICAETQPRGWGYLQLEMGRTHYKEGKIQSSNICKLDCYHKALTAYHNAIQTLTREQFPELRLETLIDLSKVYLAQKNLDKAHESQTEAVDIFRDLLNAKSTFAAKKRFQLKYSGLRQFNVDLFVDRGDSIRALEAAELDKNNCLTWLLSSFEDTTISPSFEEMKRLLGSSRKTLEISKIDRNPPTPLQRGTSEAPDGSATTAIVYWHLSEENLTTFILMPADSQPILWESDRAQQAREFNTWLGEWDRDYNDYRANKTPDRNHPWRQQIAQRLKQLSQILEIDKIGDRLPANLTRLMLIPHRDLHRFPLHIFFLTTRKLTKLQGCVYLPSIQIGLNLHQRSSTPPVYTPLLSISDPETEQPELQFAPIESAIVRCLLQSNLNHSHTEIDRQSADVDTVKDALTQPHATFHFTGHAGYDPRNPAVSALALTDGLLTAEDIWQLDLSSYDLVNLPACETAITGRKDIATEYVGLASAFLHAGAANVLSTLWNVDERASTWFTIYFYQQLLAGKSPAVALTITQVWMKNLTWQDLINWLQQLSQLTNLKIGTIDRLNAHITNIQNERSIMGLTQPTTYSHPYYWAAFTLTGRG